MQHIQFEGYDADLEGTCYGSSIPASKAADPRGDVLLAYQMNGECVSKLVSPAGSGMACTGISVRNCA